MKHVYNFRLQGQGNKYFLFRRISFIACFLLLLHTISAQSIFTNGINDPSPFSSNPFTAGQVINANITVSGIGRGSGITGNAGSYRYNAANWSTGGIDMNDYFEFTLTPNTGYLINFTSFG